MELSNQAARLGRLRLFGAAGGSGSTDSLALALALAFPLAAAALVDFRFGVFSLSAGGGCSSEPLASDFFSRLLRARPPLPLFRFSDWRCFVKVFFICLHGHVEQKMIYLYIHICTHTDNDIKQNELDKT